MRLGITDVGPVNNCVKMAKSAKAKNRPLSTLSYAKTTLPPGSEGTEVLKKVLCVRGLKDVEQLELQTGPEGVTISGRVYVPYGR